MAALNGRATNAIQRVEELADRVLLYTDDGDVAASSVGAVETLGAASVLVRRSSLEDIFLLLTGRTLDES